MTEYIVIEDDNVKFHLFQVLVNSWKRKCPTWSWPPRIIASSWATSLRQFEKQGNYHSSLWSWWYFKADSDMKGCFAQWSGYAETGHSGHAPSPSASSQNWSWTCWSCGLNYRTSDIKQSFQLWPKKMFLTCKDYLNLKSSILACRAK